MWSDWRLVSKQRWLGENCWCFQQRHKSWVSHIVENVSHHVFLSFIPFVSSESRSYLFVISNHRTEDNTLIGMIPNVLQSLSNLHVLRLSANVLTGLHFMERIVNPGQLQVLDLSNNRFFGLEFASGIGSFSNLISIDYSRSGLGAAWKKLPTGLGQLSDSLRSFRATFAGLGATIPTEVGLLAKLEIFDVQLNLLTGMVPTELAQLTRLSKCILYQRMRIELVLFVGLFFFFPFFPHLTYHLRLLAGRSFCAYIHWNFY